jgi:DNA gyrase subunit A
MGLLTGSRTKSANIVGQTMRLNPHGDAAIYETMVRLSKGYEALLTPFVDSKENFGKTYSRTCPTRLPAIRGEACAICTELFRDIDKDTVEFSDNYDGSMKEPTLLPTAFPMCLCQLIWDCGWDGEPDMRFQSGEVCETAINYIRIITII